MILFHGITTYHILKFSVFKLRFYPEEIAILLLPTFILHKPDFVHIKNVLPIFSEIHYFDWERDYEGITKETINTEISKKLKLFLHDDSLLQFNEIFIARAEFLFGSYLCQSKLNFNWLEEADGRYSYPEPIMNDDTRLFPFRYQLALENGLYAGDNVFVKKRYVNHASQSPDFDKSSCLDFNIVDEMSRLTEHQKEQLLSFFNFNENLQIAANSALVLTQHFCNMRQLSYEQHIKCYQSTADYYLEDFHVYYKLHPSDLMPYSSFMKNCTLLSGHYPSELFLLQKDIPFAIGASINSTGILNLKEISNDILTFNQEYSSTFHHNHLYYVATKIMDLFEGYNFFTIGVNVVQLENMIRFRKEKVCHTITSIEEVKEGLLTKTNTKIIIADTVTSDYTDQLADLCSKTNDDDIVIFLNSDNLYSRCYPYMSDDYFIIQIQIEKKYTPYKKNYHSIVIKTKSEIAKENIKKMSFCKELSNAEEILSINEQSKQSYEILALKGMLEATQEQLKRVMLERDELLERIKQ